MGSEGEATDRYVNVHYTKDFFGKTLPKAWLLPIMVVPKTVHMHAVG